METSSSFTEEQRHAWFDARVSAMKTIVEQLYTYGENISRVKELLNTGLDAHRIGKQHLAMLFAGTGSLETEEIISENMDRLQQAHEEVALHLQANQDHQELQTLLTHMRTIPTLIGREPQYCCQGIRLFLAVVRPRVPDLDCQEQCAEALSCLVENVRCDLELTEESHTLRWL